MEVCFKILQIPWYSWGYIPKWKCQPKITQKNGNSYAIMNPSSYQINVKELNIMMIDKK